MDTILHYTDGNLTLIATASFVTAYILGAWLFEKLPVFISIVGALALFYVRSKYPPLSLFAIGSVTLLHLFAGSLTARIVRRSLNKKSADKSNES